MTARPGRPAQAGHIPGISRIPRKRGVPRKRSERNGRPDASASDRIRLTVTRPFTLPTWRLRPARRGATNSLRVFFFRRRKPEVSDLRGIVDDPVEGLRRAGDRPFLLEVPVESMRAVGFAGADPWNPFVLTLREYAAGQCGRFKVSLLDDFYRCWQVVRGGRGGAPRWIRGRMCRPGLTRARKRRRTFLPRSSVGLAAAGGLSCRVAAGRCEFIPRRCNEFRHRCRDGP